MNHVNFVPAERRVSRRNRRRLRALGAICGAFVAVVVLTTALARGFASPDAAGLDAEIARTNERLDDSRTMVVRLQAELRQESAVVQANRAIGRQPDWGQLLALIADIVGDDIMLQSCRLDVDPGAARVGDDRPRRCRLELGGLGTTQDSVTGFVLRLEETQLFDEVQLGGTEREQFEDETRVGFELSCVATMEGGA